MNYSHGMTKTPEHIAWKNMKARCFNPNYQHYSHYGSRGITVCDRWLNFKNFIADMGSRPTAKHSLDRIDNNADYSPENCKWSTNAEQQNNRRNNKPLITIGNETWTIAQWTEKKGYGKTVIRTRLNSGWSDYDAVMTPIDGKIKLITIEGKTYTIVQWAKKMGYGKSVIQGRLKMGWSEFDAVMTPVRHRKSS